jgi:hypothetical protein
MLRTLADLNQYFRNLVEASTDLKSIVVGDSEEILSLDRDSLDYPVLWLETPTVNWSLSQVAERTYTFFFVILINAKPENWKHQEYIMHRTLELTNRVLSQIRSDHLEDVLKMDVRAQSDPILGYGHDHDYGWRTRLSLMMPMTKCQPCEFPSHCPVGAWAAFEWHNNVNGDFSNLVLTDRSNYAELSGWSVTWHWKIDNQNPQSSAATPGPDLGPGSFMLIWLELQRDKCTLIASAYVTSNISCGESVPYLLSIEYC